MSSAEPSRIASLRRLLETTGAAPGRWVATTVVVSLVLAGLDMLGVLEATRERGVAAVDALREPDGTLAWRPTLRHTVAVA